MPTKLDQIYERTPAYVKLAIAKSFDIAERILDILDAKGWSQKDLADALGKKESEISRWMKGTHNFTLETLAKIELALGCAVIQTATQKEEGELIGSISTVRTLYLDQTGEAVPGNDYASIFKLRKEFTIDVDL